MILYYMFFLMSITLLFYPRKNRETSVMDGVCSNVIMTFYRDLTVGT